MLHSPDTAGPERIMREVTAALVRLPFVHAVSVFGSLANGRADCWSDVDMVVACNEVETSKWLAATEIRAAQPVLCYREFSAVEQPAGRYWFEGESPFQRLDVSFHTVEEHLGGYRDSRGMADCGEFRAVYVRGANSSPLVSSLGPFPRLHISSRETEIGKWIHRLFNSLKAQFRGQDRSEEVAGRAAGLRASLGEMTRESSLDSGRIGFLAYQLLDIADQLLGR